MDAGGSGSRQTGQLGASLVAAGASSGMAERAMSDGRHRTAAPAVAYGMARAGDRICAQTASRAKASKRGRQARERKTPKARGRL